MRRNPLILLAPRPGLEPGAYGLTVGGSNRAAGRANLTFGGLVFQYFRVVCFDFHRARAPDDYWILEALQAPIAWFNEEAGTKVQGHGLRATFASIAKELVSSALLKRMMNHAAAGDVTLGHLRGRERGAASGRIAGRG